LQYPERIYRQSAGVTAIDFSSEFPNFLAVGLYDGNIAIYDVSSASAEPILTTAFASFKHTHLAHLSS
jgi:WD40 repeat protein